MNYKKYVLLFNLIFLLCLTAITLLYPHVPGLDHSSYTPINILSEVEKDSTGAVHSPHKKNGTGPVLAKGNTVVKDYLTSTSLVNSAGDKIALSSFIDKLIKQKKEHKQKIRIGYFGDSFIEGDLITKDLRQMLQDTFGGNGVGFMPVTSISAGFRTSIIHSFSKDWNDISFKSDNRSSENLFLSGHSFHAASGSWVSYQGVKENHLDTFTNMQVLYGMPKDNSALNLTVNGTAQSFQPQQLFNVNDIPIGKTRSVNIADNSSDVPLYGFSLESPTGVTVDNFSFRGISGVELDNFKPDFLKQLQAVRPYDLLIIHYGPNLLFKPDLVEFNWYKKKMVMVLKKIREAFPETSILLVSTADKGSRYNGEWQTQKGVEPLIDVQYEMASEDGLDFLNLYNAMGGKNSMVGWVNQQPALANKDYTHVNAHGAKKIADILFNAILKELDDRQKNPD